MSANTKLKNFELLTLNWYHFMILVNKIIFVVFDYVKISKFFNVVFVLIHSDSFWSLWKKGTISG